MAINGQNTIMVTKSSRSEDINRRQFMKDLVYQYSYEMDPGLSSMNQILINIDKV